MAFHVLLVQKDREITQPLLQQFHANGDETWQSWDLDQAYALVGEIHPDLLIMDLHFEDARWCEFLSRVRMSYPEVKVVMTAKFADPQREMLAREQGVQDILRQPFSPEEVMQAAGYQEYEPPAAAATQPPALPVAAGLVPGKGNRPADIRLPVRVKITLPYLFLALLFALSSAYIVSQVALESIEDRFLNQLIATGRQSTDWMVREEDRLLETLRLISNTQGVAEAVKNQDAEALRDLVLPAAVNAAEEAVEVLDPTGESILSMRAPPGGLPQSYVFSRGDTTFRDWDFVQLVASKVEDRTGNKFAGTGKASWGDYFYVSGPIMDADGNLVGILLVGKPLRSLINEMHLETLGEITLYDRSGRPIVSTLFAGEDTVPVTEDQVAGVLGGQDSRSLTRDLTASTINYTEILGPWEARGGLDQGILGVALAQTFLVRTSQATQLQIFILVAASVLLVLLIGFYLASLITRPLQRLVSASSEVAQGNLEVKVDVQGNDEVAVLAQSFNYMIAGLQEGSMYRDLLGRTVSPQVREQLRQTFNSGSFRLEGQEAVATVIMSDIRGFTTISEKSDPATVFRWLNEYFTHIVPVVASYGGVVNKFDGDAMLAFFGILPQMLEPDQSASAACHAALEILQAVDAYNLEREQRGDPPLVTGVGLHTGVVISGGLGSTDRLHYTIIGDTVNTTQRIESLTREVMDSSGVLISSATYEALADERTQFNLLPLGAHNLKGKQEQIEVYRLLPPATEEGK